LGSFVENKQDKKREQTISWHRGVLPSEKVNLPQVQTAAHGSSNIPPTTLPVAMKSKDSKGIDDSGSLYLVPYQLQ